MIRINNWEIKVQLRTSMEIVELILILIRMYMDMGILNNKKRRKKLQIVHLIIQNHIINQ
jgi:hypothetical protein